MMMKKLIAVLLTLMLCAGMIPGMVITASASEADAWDGTTASQAWESGSGTETDPYIIMTAEQLARLAANVNGGTSYAEKYFKLGANLDLNGEIQTWIPIGNYESIFAGHFNGDGKVISNMKAHGPTSNNQKNAYRALFGNASGVIRNFTLENPDSNCYWGYVATAVAYSSGGTVKDIMVTNPNVNVGNIGNKDCIGGVIGYIENGTVSNCIVTGGAVTSKFDNTGGIVGLAVDTEISGCKVSDMTITSTSQYTGGIVGQSKYTDGTNSIRNCTVENSTITSTSAGVGGIVGYGLGNSAGKIIVELCSVTGGSVTASYYAGGIMGQSFYADIIGCCNYGSPVTATSNTGYAGGILGYYNIGNCYSCFSSAVITASKYPGAIIGRDQSYYYECAYDKTLYTTNLTYSNTKGFTTEEIKAGAAAYHLATTGTKTQNYHDWGQKIGTDLYPVWNTNNDASIVVHREEGPSGYIYYNEGAVDVFEPNADGYYEISDTETWYKFARKAEEDHTVKAIVVDDINFSDVSSDQLADYRIGDDYHFAGIFNGNGRIVSGLPETGDPLFGAIGESGKLTCLTVSGVTVSGGQYGSKAGLVQKNNGTIENCTISNVILTGSMGAGLVFENKGTVTGCKAENVNINTTAASAGLVHSNYGSIENSTVSGTVKAIYSGTDNNDAWAGGICFITRGGTITGCTNSASVYAESAKDLASAAGIVAAPIRNDDDAIVTISGCVNIGNIEAKGGGMDYAAGISSIYETSAYAYISLSYNTGIITADTAAGIAAHMNTGSITNCYNAGPINARHTAGGISGNVCTITNCHNYGKVTSEYYAAPICATGPDSWPQGRLTNTYGIENNIEAPEKNTFYDTSSGKWAEAVTAGSTKDQFENGEIAYLLQQANGNTQVWSQGENYPVFVSAENPVIVKVDFYTVIDGTASTETLATAYVNAGQTLGNKYPASPDAQYIVEGYYSDSSCTTKINTETYAPQSNTTIYVQLVDSHVHSWIYEAEDTNGDQVNDTITATCANTDNNCPTTDGGSVSIALPDSMEYTGSAIEAKVTDNLIPEHTVVYSGDGLVADKPVNPGTYTATITRGSAEISVTYTITDVLNGIAVTADPTGDVAIPTKGNTQNITLTAKADYAYNDAEVTADATWSLADTYNGVTIENNVITIAPEAAAGTISVKASYNGKEQTTVISLTKAGAGDLFVLGEILGADSVSVNGATEDQTATYAITGEDKYGTVVTPAVVWSVAGMDDVTIDANGVLTVPKDAPTGAVTITATAESLSKTKTVSITAHEHNWTYAANGDTLTATCGKEGCLSTNKELKIIAPALNVYGDTKSEEATLSATSIGDIATLPAIQYEQKDGESWTVLSSAPVIPGSYRASITVDTNKTASVEYTIDQATLTVNGTGIASGTYGAKLNELTVSGLTAMLNGTEVPGAWTLTGDNIPNVGDTESYTATFTPAANAAYYKPLTAQVTLDIDPAQHTAPTAVVGSYEPNANKTAFVYTVSEPSGIAYEYSKNGTDWQDSPVFDGFNAGNTATFYARVKADSNHTASNPSQPTQVTFEKLDQAAPALSYQVSGNSGNRTITIAEVEGAEYSFDGGNTWGSSNVKNGINDETVSIAIRMKETAVYKASEKVSASVNTAKQVQTVTFDTTDRTATYGDGTLEAREASAEGAITYESSDETVATVDDKGVVTIVGVGTATITAKAAETETHAAAQASYSLTVNPKALTAEGITLTLIESLYQYDGTAKTPVILLKDGNTVLEADKDYQVKDGSTTTASAIAVYTITLTGKGNYTGEISEEWEITKIAAPAAPQNLQGVAPTTGLVNDGKIIGTTDEMEYATTADFSDAKDCGEGETTNLAPGTYYVRLKGTDTTEPGVAAVVNVPAYSAPVVTFDANGGTVAIVSVTTEQDGTLAELPTATRNGYEFNGWFTAKTGGTQVTVDTFFSVSTTIYAQWTYIPVPPVIDSPAADTIVEVYEGQTAQMTVVSQNATSYQWFINRNDGAGFVEYDGSTLATHTTAVVKPENDGFRYYCLVTNADGSVRSHVFTLKVLEQIDLPQTGDNSQIGLWMAMCFISISGMIAITMRGKKKRTE